MAVISVACFPKRSVNLILLRHIKRTYCEQKLVQSSPKSLTNSGDTPVKFTTNKASTISIAETTGLLDERKGRSKIALHIVFSSLAVFLIYFCYLREENDIDEILKGNVQNESNEIKILKLKVQLQYCQKHRLPTEALRAKIQELEAKQEKIYNVLK